MTKKDVIELLCEYGNNKKYIRDIYDEMNLLLSDIDNMRQITSANYDGMPKGNKIGNPTAEAAAYIVDVYDRRVQQLKWNVDKIMERKKLCEELLKRLTDDERKVITERYINGTRWDFIPGILHFDRSWCFVLRKRALKKMCDFKSVD